MANWTFKTRTVQPIGLDVGHDSVKMVQLAVSGAGVSVLAADRAHIDPDISDNGEERRRFIVLTIKQMLAEGRFRGRNVVSSLPNEKLKMTSLRLADAEMTQIDQVLRREAASRFGLDPDKDTIRYMHAGTVHQGDDTKNELILFAADNESIKSHIGMLEDAGLKPVGIDAMPCALLRSFERGMRRQEDRERTVIFADVGHCSTTVVFGRAAELCFVKQIPIGADRFNREVAAKLGVGLAEAEMLRIKLQKENIQDVPLSPEHLDMNAADQDGQISPSQRRQDPLDIDPSTRQLMVDVIGSVSEELSREISLCSRYYTVTFRGKRIERAVVSGGGAYENILLDVLKRSLGVEVEVAEPLRGFSLINLNLDSDKLSLACEWTVAVGLSLKGWDRTVKKDVRAREHASAVQGLS